MSRVFGGRMMAGGDDGVWIVQCLCPRRHCIMAVAYEPGSMDHAAAEGALREAVARAIAGGLLNPWCALCGSRDFGYSAGRTPYRTIAEARAPLAELERRQEATREWLLSRRPPDA
jgi:hypothetical protein